MKRHRISVPVNKILIYTNFRYVGNPYKCILVSPPITTEIHTNSLLEEEGIVNLYRQKALSIWWNEY